MSRFLFAALALGVALGLGASAAPVGESADLILRHGKIATVDDRRVLLYMQKRNTDLAAPRCGHLTRAVTLPRPGRR